MENEKVSIIIPVHNAEEYLSSCIESILKQTYSDIEIIIINDYSTDNSGIICKQYKEKDSRINVLEHKKCEGVSKSRNDGLSIATGIYIAFVDADDTIDERFIQKLVSHIEDNDIVITGYKKFCNKYEKRYVLSKEQCEGWDSLFFHILCSNLIGGYCFNKMYKKKILDDLSFDSNISISEDFIFLLKYLKNCTKYAYIPETLYEYRVNPKSAINSGKNKKTFNPNIISCIEAMKIIDQLMNEESKKLRNYASYRVIKGNLWVMLQFIHSNTYDKKVIKNIRNMINNHYSNYKQVHCGSVYQRMAICILLVSPRLLFLLGRFFCRFFHKFFLRIITD